MPSSNRSVRRTKATACPSGEKTGLPSPNEPAGGNVSRRRFKKTTERSPTQLGAPDLVKRDFTATAPDEIEDRVRVTRTVVAGRPVFDANGSV